MLVLHAFVREYVKNDSSILAIVVLLSYQSFKFYSYSPVWGRGTLFSPLSIYFLIFPPFYFSFSFIGFTCVRWDVKPYSINQSVIL